MDQLDYEAYIEKISAVLRTIKTDALFRIDPSIGALIIRAAGKRADTNDALLQASTVLAEHDIKARIDFQAGGYARRLIITNGDV